MSNVKYASWILVLAGLLVMAPQRGRAEQSQTAAPEAEADHAPRAYGVALSGTYAFLSRLPLTKDGSSYRPAGVAVGARFGWQVRGLRGGAPSTIGVETDFLFLPGRDARNGYGLVYGVFAKHAFTQLRVRPYFAYGLGAAQIWISDVGGRGIGHATRLAFGVDIRVGERLHVSIALSYLGLLMPRFALDGAPARDTSAHSGVLSTGVWFGQ
jgi:hypothetical protein